ncbi:hypothetical protein ACFOHK_08430 [Falsigemmobacter intermedius]|uniref:Uncharacterized protein n=1 Tax=Falsigemmobacter intermedius TaxID=1553448 RepID=A0A451GGQ5_9RHOB|nr:hypothetical protein [Falsigemmobacter intermedius]RWY36395.1 hypothetical protein EP867_18140 [Falsigemmobacter intermedius]
MSFMAPIDTSPLREIRGADLMGELQAFIADLQRENAALHDLCAARAAENERLKADLAAVKKTLTTDALPAIQTGKITR